MNTEKMFLTVVELMRTDDKNGINTVADTQDVINGLANENLTEQEKEFITKHIKGYKRNIEILCDKLNKGIDVIELNDRKLKYEKDGQTFLTFFKDVRTI
jgi:hypothetical protein